MSIRIKTTPTIDIAEIEQAVADEELLTCAFQDAVMAMARYAMVGRARSDTRAFRRGKQAMNYDPNERKQLERDIVERAAMIERLERDDRARRAFETSSRDEVVTKSAPTQRTQVMGQDVAAQWQQYIAREIERSGKSWTKASMSAVGEVLREERDRVAADLAKMRLEFEAELAKIRIEFLQNQLDEARGVRRIEPAPAGRSFKVVRDEAVDAASLIG